MNDMVQAVGIGLVAGVLAGGLIVAVRRLTRPKLFDAERWRQRAALNLAEQLQADLDGDQGGAPAWGQHSEHLLVKDEVPTFDARDLQDLAEKLRDHP